MNMIGKMLFAATIAGVTYNAHAVEVKEKLEIPVSADKVWEVADEFCSIKDWSPIFSDCTQFMEYGVHWRILTIADGGEKVKEKLTDVTDYSYDYAITEAPLPIANHQGKMWVEKGNSPDQSTLYWHVSFDVNGDAETTENTTNAIRGILVESMKGIKASAIAK